MYLALILLSSLVLLKGDNCPNPSAYSGRVLCDHAGGYCGECVSFYKICSGDRRTTSQWIQGALVKGNFQIPIGTGIATFPNGKYYGHAAIYMGQNSEGIQVWDQWKGHPVSTRTIRWGGSGISNDGNGFYVIAGGSGSSSVPPVSPPTSSYGSCNVNGATGTCINTNMETCTGTLWSGYCPGASNIRCCTAGNWAFADDFSSDVDGFVENFAVADTNTQLVQQQEEPVAPLVVVCVVGVLLVIVLAVLIVLLFNKTYPLYN